MNDASGWTLVLWTVHGLLALVFLAAGAAQLIGCAEVLGAARLVLPMATGVLPWLTPLAALGLAVVVGHALGAIVAIPVAVDAPEAVRAVVLEAPPLSGTLWIDDDGGRPPRRLRLSWDDPEAEPVWLHRCADGTYRDERLLEREGSRDPDRTDR
jgi:pimeloyl-ACP methyl ester carboxylesterase